MKKTATLVLLALLSGFAGSWFFQRVQPSKKSFIEGEINTPTRTINLENYQGSDLSFVAASETATPTVVFIKTESEYQRQSSFDWFWDFDPFGSRGKVSSSGSGVIVSSDGYIVTNHHVIKNADKIEVTLNNGKFSYQAELIGQDPSSDLALLKINKDNLKSIEFANSDEVRIGEWVLAVGNPFNLNSTVTAGIVSAKGRNINILNNRFPIESFIQTDAAINPGNSGGALVNLNGQLIGVNTAIASETGSYVGYGFAIPSNIVKKIIADLKEFGRTQRAFTGFNVLDLTEDISREFGDEFSGVFVSKVYLDNTNLKVGDIITHLEGYKITSKSVFDERLAYYRPGDKIKIDILRNDKEKSIELLLIGENGGTSLKKKITAYSKVFDTEFEEITVIDKQSYEIDWGIKVASIGNKSSFRNIGLGEGFIITSFNGYSNLSLDEFVDKIENTNGRIRIEGINTNGTRQYLNYYVR